MAGEAGKGDKPRPLSVSKEVWDENWERIFRKKKSNKNTRPHCPQENQD